MMLRKNEVVEFLLMLGDAVQVAVSAELRKQVTERALVVYEGKDDVIFSIDKNVEDKLLLIIDQRSAKLGGIELTAEGIHDQLFPSKGECRWKLILDPIDGTRGIMYDKRPAFFLAGIAENKGEETSLKDIEYSVMLELPVSKSMYSDRLWAARGRGWGAERKRISYNNSENNHGEMLQLLWDIRSLSFMRAWI